MTEARWDLDSDRRDSLGKPVYPDPGEIVAILRRNPATGSLVFAKRDRVYEIFKGLQRERDVGARETSYAGFAERYRSSLEYAWFSVCALIKSDQDVSCASNGDRFELIVGRSAAEKIRGSTDLDIHRAAIVPEVMASIFYNFARSVDHVFAVPIGRDELKQSRAHTTIAISAVEFVRGMKESEDEAGYYNIPTDRDKLQRYGFSSSDIARRVDYKGKVERPTYKKGVPKFPSFLCYPSFTDADQSGMNLAVARSKSGRVAEEVSSSLPGEIWWHNHHECREGACIGKDCPNCHFEGTNEFRAWRDYSIVPYVKVRQAELNSRLKRFDYSIILSFGVKFGDDLLGFFLSMCIARGRDDKEITRALGKFMTDVRAHAGHIRFSMIVNLATEIAGALTELSNARQRHGQMLSILSGPINDLRKKVIGAIDDARRITQITQGPHAAIFVKAAEVAEFFQEGKPVRIGKKQYQIAHEPSDYRSLAAQAAIFSAILIRLFGKDLNDSETALDLYRRATSLILDDQDELDGPLARLCRELVDLDEKEIARIEVALATQTKATDPRLRDALLRLKDILLTPAKADSEKYPWAPLLLVLLEDGKQRDVRIELANMESEQFKNLSEGIRWINDGMRDVFLPDLPLPVPRYDMLLTFVADILAFDRSARERKRKEDIRRPTVVVRERENEDPHTGSTWTVKIPLSMNIEKIDKLADNMMRVSGTRGHTYSGNLHGPFLEWAAMCQADENLPGPKGHRPKGLIFAVEHRGVRSAIRFSKSINQEEDSFIMLEFRNV